MRDSSNCDRGQAPTITGGGARTRPESVEAAQILTRDAVTRLTSLGLAEEEIRRLFEAELTRLREQNSSEPFGRKKMTVTSPIIEITDLKKNYGSVDALRGLDLRVPRGAICGFLGPNGSGKTTTMKILMGLVHPSAGQVKVFGLRSSLMDEGVTIRQRTAFVSEDKDLPMHMTLPQTVATTRPLFPAWNDGLFQRLVEGFGLLETRRPGSLSRGMRTRAALAGTEAASGPVDRLATYEGFLWSLWFKGFLLGAWSVYAAIWGSLWNNVFGAGLTGSWNSGVNYTLSLPISRRRLFGIGSAAGAFSLLVLAVVPSLLVPVFAKSVGESYPVSQALIHSLMLFVGGVLIFSFSLLLSTLFKSTWTAMFIAVGFVVALWPYRKLTEVPSEFPKWNLYHLMSGETYFLHGRVPWEGLAACLAVSFVLFQVSVRLFERRDF